MEQVQQLKPYQNLPEALLDEDNYMNAAMDSSGGATNSLHAVVDIPVDSATNGVRYMNIPTNQKGTPWNTETYDTNTDSKREHTTITFSPLPQPTYDLYETSSNEEHPQPDYIEATPYTAGMPCLMSHAELKAYKEAKRTNPLPSTPARTYDQQDGTHMLYFNEARRQPEVQRARHPYENDIMNETGI
jgi:hypothetical protein